MDDFLGERWHYAPEVVWIGWLMWELMLSTADNRRYRLYRISTVNTLLALVPRYLIWWAGGFFAAWWWPQWTVLFLSGWLLWPSIRYNGITITKKVDAWSALGGTLLNVFLLYMGGFWG